MKKNNPIILIAAFALAFSAPVFVNAQEDEDEKKMIREVIDVQVDKPPTPVTPPAEEETSGKKKKKKKYEEPPLEEINPEEESGTIPAPVEELKKRGMHWMNVKHRSYTKTAPVSSGTSIECTVSVPYKPKELNPGAPVDGKITMTVVIDCKPGKYRYTVKDIKHVANNSSFSGGDVFEDTPACGTLSMPDPQWKKIKSFAIQKANEVAGNLKESMKEPVKEKKDDW